MRFLALRGQEREKGYSSSKAQRSCEGYGDGVMDAYGLDEQKSAGQDLLMRTALLLVAQTDSDVSRFPRALEAVKALVNDARLLANGLPEVEVISGDEPVPTDRIQICVSPREDGALRIEVVYAPGSTVYLDVFADGTTGEGGVTAALRLVEP